MNKCYNGIVKRLGRPQLAVLIDPEKYNPQLVSKANKIVDMYFVGGSTLKPGQINKVITSIKKLTKRPVIIFPGDDHQLDKNADAILFLSLISGREPEYLIGKQVKSAYKIKAAQLEAIPTGYILVDGGRISETQRVSGSQPMKLDNKKNIVHTAIAGEMLGMKLIYLEAGSGAKRQIPYGLIKNVKSAINIPLIVGGGIDSRRKAEQAIKAGADVVVIGNALEKELNLLEQLTDLFLK